MFHEGKSDNSKGLKSDVESVEMNRVGKGNDKWRNETEVKRLINQSIKQSIKQASNGNIVQ